MFLVMQHYFIGHVGIRTLVTKCSLQLLELAVGRRQVLQVYDHRPNDSSSTLLARASLPIIIITLYTPSPSPPFAYIITKIQQEELQWQGGIYLVILSPCRRNQSSPPIAATRTPLIIDREIYQQKGACSYVYRSLFRPRCCKTSSISMIVYGGPGNR